MSSPVSESPAVRSIDTLICAAWIVPIEPEGVVLEDHALAIKSGRIVAILPAAEARKIYRANEYVELGHHVLLPGLVNLHTHAAMSLLRGYADDQPLMRWLQDSIWPAESRNVSERFVRDGTLLAAAEMLRGGVTCFADMYFYPEAAAEAVLEVGIRAALGLVVFEFPTAYASDADDYLAKGLLAHDRLREHATLSFCLAPHAPYTVADKSFERVAALSAQLDLPIHTHLHETRGEVEDSMRLHGMRPLQRLQQLDIANSGLLAAHAIYMEPEELAFMAARGTSIAHCSTSNMKLASGIAPIAMALEHGVNVGLGTDGAASNNRLDMFQEMRHAALLAKVAALDAGVLQAHQVLRMATLNGARALGLGDRIGSLVPGKEADLCAVSLDDWITQPCFDPVSHLIYVAGREQVTHVWVRGEKRLIDATLTTQNMTKLKDITALWQNPLGVLRRAGASNQSLKASVARPSPDPES